MKGSATPGCTRCATASRCEPRHICRSVFGQRAPNAHTERHQLSAAKRARTAHLAPQRDYSDGHRGRPAVNETPQSPRGQPLPRCPFHADRICVRRRCWRWGGAFWGAL